MHFSDGEIPSVILRQPWIDGKVSIHFGQKNKFDVPQD